MADEIYVHILIVQSASDDTAGPDHIHLIFHIDFAYSWKLICKVDFDLIIDFADYLLFDEY